jgi:hypothetical protein
VKIGYARDVGRRMTKMQADNHKILTCLAVIEGGRAEEADIHARFSEARLHGEWFAPVPDLLSYIKALPAWSDGLPIGRRLNKIGFIDDLGGGTAIAARLTELTGQPVDREIIYKWKEHDHVPWRWRPLMATLAREKEIGLPEGFFDFAPAER